MNNSPDALKEAVILVVLMLLFALLTYSLRESGTESGKREVRAEAIRLGYAEFKLGPDGNASFVWRIPEAEKK